MDEKDTRNSQDNAAEMELNEERSEHGKIFALFLRQPFADDLANGRKTIEIRSKCTPYRGRVLICSTTRYSYGGRNPMMAGCSVGIAELYDIMPVSELTGEEWEHTRVPIHRRMTVKGGWAWLFRDCKRIIEYPCRSKNKIAWVPFHEGDIFPYPQNVILDINLFSQ